MKLEKCLRKEIANCITKISNELKKEEMSCLVEAIAILVENPREILRMKDIVSVTAQNINRLKTSVYNSIRSASVKCFESISNEMSKEIFGNSLIAKSGTPEEFVRGIAEYISEEPYEIKLIGKHLKNLGIPASWVEYDYLKKSISFGLEDGIKHKDIVKKMKEELGVKNKAFSLGVHRAREYARSYIAPEIWESYFGHAERINSSKFIQTILEKVKAGEQP